nr:serine hydrolase domain-containing protein [uncultured Sphingomonas sp.]
MTLPQADDGARVMLTFDRTHIGTARADGFADPAAGRRVSASDPVRIASISKLVVAIGVMRLVDDGMLDLDRPVAGYLGYVVENPSFKGEAVTLRQLLSHTSSLRDHDDQYAIPLGQTLRAVLDDPASWDAAHGPGDSYFTYANLNFPVIGSVVERVTGERFDRAMKRLVLDPMAIDACFNWPTCSDDAVADAVVLMQDGAAVKDDLHGRRPDCPVQPGVDGNCDLDRWAAGTNGALFAPQGGLRISATDLARIGQMLANDGVSNGIRILKVESVKQMLAPAWSFDGSNGQTEGGFHCRYGLGVMLPVTPKAGCADNPGLPGGDWVGHAGEAYGLRSGLWFDRRTGRGMAYYSTGLPAAPPKGKSAFTAAEEAQVSDAVTELQQRP